MLEMAHYLLRNAHQVPQLLERDTGNDRKQRLLAVLVDAPLHAEYGDLREAMDRFQADIRGQFPTT